MRQQFGALLGCLGLALCAPSPSRACQEFVSPPWLVGVPANDETGVPTNVILFYEVPALVVYRPLPDEVPGAFSLKSSDGEVLGFSLRRQCEAHFELIPAQALQPNTSYVFSASWIFEGGREVSEQLSFVTGDGPLERAPEPPRAIMQNYATTNPDRNTCSTPLAGNCVSLADEQPWVEYSLIDELGQNVRTYCRRGSSVVSRSGPSPYVNYRCVGLRTRAANGWFSKRVRLCEADAPKLDLSDLEDFPGLTCNSAGFAWCDYQGRQGSAPSDFDEDAGPPVARCPSGPTFGDPAPSDPPDAGPPKTIVDASAARPEPAADGCSIRPSTRHHGSYWPTFLIAAAGLRLSRRQRSSARR